MTATVEDRQGVEAPAELDGVDLRGGCPNCGDDDAPVFVEYPAGYYTCDSCGSTWSGHFDNASLVLFLRADYSGIADSEER